MNAFDLKEPWINRHAPIELKVSMISHVALSEGGRHLHNLAAVMMAFNLSFSDYEV